MNAPTRRIGIGIDTGGTFTDAVAIDLASGALLAKAKAPTTHEDLTRGVRDALLSLDDALFGDVEVVALSTTLATNAVVEGKGARVGLLIGVPDPATFDLPPGLPVADVAVLAAAHGPDGGLRTALDIDAARDALSRILPRVEAVAVSTYFSVANLEHEAAIERMVAERSDAPVVCGHQLSQRIGMVERAVTAALNARLLPLVRDLLDAVRATLDSLGITAPLMVVKGDGSLTTERVARERPVETVLSGPAASVVGACRLSGLSNALVADMGGTTTDIAFVNGGMPEVNPEGALVGYWRTRVQALDVRTVGLGGDSRIHLAEDGRIAVGPARVIPLCVAARRFPTLLDALRTPAPGSGAPRFLALVRRPPDVSARLEALFAALDERPMHLLEAQAAGGPFVDLESLVRSGYLAEIGVTPTDVLCAPGDADLGDVEAARLGLRVLAGCTGSDADTLAAAVQRSVVERLALETATRALAEDVAGPEPCVAQTALLAHLLGDSTGRALSGRLTLGVPLVAVGAPAGAWFPDAASQLGAAPVIPPHSEVANAFGALAGRVLERAEARVKAEPDGTFLVITPDERYRTADLPTARGEAERLATRAAERAARAAGATDVTVALAHDEVTARSPVTGDDVFVEATVVSTAAGRPYL